jgi:hypothetical protein
VLKRAPQRLVRIVLRNVKSAMVLRARVIDPTERRVDLSVGASRLSTGNAHILLSRGLWLNCYHRVETSFRARNARL